MTTKIQNCDYAPKTTYKIGGMTFCSISPDKCPYKQSLKFSSEEKPLFRCKSNGKIEKILKKDIPEETLTTR